jgi:AbrB family looped-hinge helix DNA binding protein
MAECDLTSHFMGAATVGERGQVVIPAEARERLEIKPGDKLLVIVHPGDWGVTFLKFERLQEYQRQMELVIQRAEDLQDQSGPGEPGEEGDA